MNMDAADNRLVAVIDIGATAIRLVVAEIHSDKSWKSLERAGKPVPLGRDVFGSGRISSATINVALGVLTGFRELLASYAVPEGSVTVIATSALREARNRDTFVDRVAIKTGFCINIVEGIEENRLTYLAVRYALQAKQSTFARSNALIIEVGGGSTEVMVLERGKVVSAHAISFGTVRIEQQLRAAGSTAHKSRFLRENVRNVLEVLGNEFDLTRIRHFIAVGADARLAAERVGRPESPMYSVIDKERFADFVRSIDSLSVDECVSHLRIPYDQADSIGTGLLMYQLFLEGTNADHLVVPQVSIREGVLLSITRDPDETVAEEFVTQVLASAESIGRKYQYDADHSHHVATLALSLFDQLSDEHGLTAHDRLLLHVASLLHDIGSFVKGSGHHKHGHYLVSNSDIFGLHADDISIVANVVRYHRKSLPMASHIPYITLSREDRTRVLKLSAMLRVADALDRAHSQRVRSISVERDADCIRVACEYRGDMSIERYGLVSKGSLFEEVFGMRITIVQMPERTGS
jgi:exopolyphosphatase / guanosine-5'-triphosphate,3'-diphosphate pyrophosphatase